MALLLKLWHIASTLAFVYAFLLCFLVKLFLQISFLIRDHVCQDIAYLVL